MKKYNNLTNQLECIKINKYYKDISYKLDELEDKYMIRCKDAGIGVINNECIICYNSFVNFDNNFNNFKTYIDNTIKLNKIIVGFSYSSNLHNCHVRVIISNNQGQAYSILVGYISSNNKIYADDKNLSKYMKPNDRYNTLELDYVKFDIREINIKLMNEYKCVYSTNIDNESLPYYKLPSELCKHPCAFLTNNNFPSSKYLGKQIKLECINNIFNYSKSNNVRLSHIEWIKLEIQNIEDRIKLLHILDPKNIPSLYNTGYYVFICNTYLAFEQGKQLSSSELLNKFIELAKNNIIPVPSSKNIYYNSQIDLVISSPILQINNNRKVKRFITFQLLSCIYASDQLSSSELKLANILLPNAKYFIKVTNMEIFKISLIFKPHILAKAINARCNSDESSTYIYAGIYNTDENIKKYSYANIPFDRICNVN